MAEQYVKFLRGTFEDYRNLRVKDEDTLYFVYNEEDATAALYLGTRLIGGNGEIVGASNLDELNDVLIKSVANKDILQYNSSSGQWVNITFESLFNQIQEKLSTSARAAVYEVVLQDEETHLQALSRAVGTAILAQGDIGIVKTLLVESNYQYTAYVYNNNTWTAMDGNYDAENVYFTSDLTTTSEIGHIKLVNGKATIPAAGKNLKQIFNTIFMDEKSPQVIQPSVNFIFNDKGVYEVGTIITPTWEMNFDDGNYEFGPSPTGVQIDSLVVTSSDGDTAYTPSGSFGDLLIRDGTHYVITAEVKYSDGNIPTTNLGNPDASSKIIGDTVVKSSQPIIGYRPYFYGVTSISVKDKANLTSDFIRNNLTDGGEYEPIVLNLKAYEGAKNLVIAVPANQTGVVEAVMPSTLNFPIPWETGSPFTVAVQGANGYTAGDYKVWVYEPALIDVLETYKITLG